MNSPIKYYGGKTYMTDIIKKYFPNQYDIYVQGFGGGASLLFSKPQEKCQIYNDLGKNVYSLFKVLANNDLFLQLKQKLDLTYYSSDIRKEFKEKLKEQNLTLLERAYYFIYVNRTSFNGVGGFSTNLITRRNMSKSVSDYLSMIDGLHQIHNRLSSVIVQNRDIFQLIPKYDSKNTFFYLDPPYVHETRSSSTSYEIEMTNEQHKQLIDLINNSQGKFLISGYYHPIYDSLKNFERIDFQSPNANSNSVETLWFNYNIEYEKDELF